MIGIKHLIRQQIISMQIIITFSRKFIAIFVERDLIFAKGAKFAKQI